MKNFGIARRYARALLLIGQENGQAETYRAELNSLTHLIEKEKDFQRAVYNPLYETTARKKVLQTVVEKLGLSAVVKAFSLLLFDKGRFGFLPSINEYYQKMADEFKGVARATLTSATPLPDESIEKIRMSLSKMTRKEVKLDVKQDPGLIGGIVTQIGDLVLDGSIKTQLLNMRESLKRGERV